MTIRWDIREHLRLGAFLFKWLAIGIPSGAGVGSAVALFLWSLDRATELQWQYPWLLYLLPLAGRMLGVRYLVHGTTQRLERRVRINVTLADALRNDVLWCEHFDRSIGDLFSVQDDVSAAIASAIEPEITRAEGERARSARFTPIYREPIIGSASPVK